MKIGILYCGFNSREHVEHTISPWVKARDEKLLGDEWVVAAISVPFKEYENTKFNADDGTGDYLSTQSLDYLIREPKFISETDARNLALRKLLDSKCELIVLADADEYFTLEQIKNLVEFIKKDKLTTWFKFSYKNYIFDEKTYLVEPFQPPRAFWVTSGGYRLNNFRHDNEVLYHGIITRDIKDFEYFSRKIIPQNVAWIKHLTWINNEKTKAKSEYQLTRWGSSLCSYKWCDRKNSLVFNLEYFTRFNKPIPEVIVEK